MKSSSGKHFVGLDHVRALAAFMVFSWHFLHGGGGAPIPFDYAPSIPGFAFFDEGHTGVALFMTLSGYLFAKLLEGKSIKYLPFLWNRLIRTMPLLMLVMLVIWVRKQPPLGEYALSLLEGFIQPTWPNGGWSVAVEIHFYFLLPLLLWMSRRSNAPLLLVLVASTSLRLYLHHADQGVQWYQYWTIVGRIDQFVLGILAYRYGNLLAGKHVWAAGALLVCSAVFWFFDRSGGMRPPGVAPYTSNDLFWVVYPTFEGLAYATGIAWYDNSFDHGAAGPVSRFISRIGQYSYSIYLLHFFLVFNMARAVDQIGVSNFYLALLLQVFAFLCFYPIGYLSYRFVEEPFLRLRKPYLISRPSPALSESAKPEPLAAAPEL